MKLDALLSIEDFRRAAQRRLPRTVYEYVAGGTEDGLSLAANRSCFELLGLRPRGLRNVANRTQTVSLWGVEYTSPIGIAPMGVTAICWPRCDMALAQAARKRGLPFVISGASCVALEEIQESAGGAWYQGYLPGDKERLARIVARLRKADISVLVVTSDTPVAANREHNQRNGFTIPFRPSWSLFLDGVRHPGWSFRVFFRSLLGDGIPRFMNLYEEPGPAITKEPVQGFRGGRDLLTWDHMCWLRDHWPGKLVIKGILHPQDALAAARCGMDGIIISNHGGRQLDGAMAPLAALPPIRAVVPDDFVVMLDGGVRRGTDVLKAVALGADMVFVGRPALYGASVAGERGTGQVLDILKAEIDRNLALLGCPHIADLNVDYLDPVQLARLFGACS